MNKIEVKDVFFSYPLFGIKKKNNKFSQHIGGEITNNKLVEIKALNGISLDLVEGDRVALCGSNGCGKSTLLRILSKIYFPDSGTVSIKGNFSSLLDNQSGFEFEATGIDNIYIRGFLLGMSKKFIDNNIDDVISFSELGNFIQYPIKTYSSGMLARLSFSIINMLDPDIYLIDEHIGTGDEQFLDKIKNKINEIIEKKKILVISSHSKELITKFCNKTVMMKQGKIIATSSIDKNGNMLDKRYD